MVFAVKLLFYNLYFEVEIK